MEVIAKLKVCSLFSGIGGIEYGFNAAGLNYETVFASELIGRTRDAYQKLHNFEPSGDITKIEAGDIPDHDLLIGGFPCQSFSIAGKRLGFVDTRGTLFFEIERILKEKKPKLVLLENVKGLMNHQKGETFKVILEKLSDLGYAVDFALLNSKKFGVAQNRERVYIVGIRGEQDKGWSTVGVSNVDKVKNTLKKNEQIKKFDFGFDYTSGERKVMADILEPEVNVKYYMDKPFVFSAEESKSPDMKMLGRIDMKGNDTIRRVYSTLGVCPTLTTMEGGHRQPKVLLGGKIRKLTPRECFRVQGFPEEAYEKLRAEGASDSLLYKVIGNSVTPQVATSIAKKLMTY